MTILKFIQYSVLTFDIYEEGRQWGFLANGINKTGYYADDFLVDIAEKIKL